MKNKLLALASLMAIMGATSLKAQLNVGSTAVPVTTLDVQGKAYVRDSVGIGITTPHAPLQLSNVLGNRRIVLYDGFNNNFQFYGFGVQGGELRYSVDAGGGTSHVFYAASSATATTELMRIQGNGNVGIGTGAATTATLDVNGTARVRSLGTGATTDKVVTTDGSGNLRQLATPLFNEVLKGQVVIPTEAGGAFSAHSTTAYDTPDFYCVSMALTAATTAGGAIVTPAYEVCVYEYTGTAMSTVTGVYTFLSAFNTSSFPDSFVGNSQGLTNNTSGNVGTGTRTQIKVKWIRVDTPANNWSASFGGSVLIVR